MSGVAVRALALLACLWASLALAAEDALPEGQRWSTVGARTAGQGRTALDFTLGWPGVSFALAHGVAPTFDLGVQLSFHYGLEGVVTALAPGAKLQGLARWRFFDDGRVSLGATFEPGPLVYARGAASFVGFAFPVGLRLGLAISSAVGVGVTVDVPLWASFGPGASLQVPVLGGLGAEYFITSGIQVSFRAKVGPTFSFPVSPAAVTLDARLGVAFRL